MFVALYLPMTKRKNPSIRGFATEKCAWEYVYTKLCGSCKAERAAALAGLKEWGEPEVDEDGHVYTREPDAYPACMCEWEVVDESEFTPEQLADLDED